MQFEFLGINVCPNGNRPTMSKHQPLQHWPSPVIVCDVAKFVGFMQFYSRFIPNFEIRITPLRDILQENYPSAAVDLWTPAAKLAFDQMQNAILSNPCLRWYDHCKLLVLHTNFSAKGFGYVACQPADNDPSLDAFIKSTAVNGCLKHFLLSSHTRSMYATLTTLFGTFVSITFH